jgi:hypothetical protein
MLSPLGARNASILVGIVAALLVWLIGRALQSDAHKQRILKERRLLVKAFEKVHRIEGDGRIVEYKRLTWLVFRQDCKNLASSAKAVPLIALVTTGCAALLEASFGTAETMPSVMGVSFGWFTPYFFTYLAVSGALRSL